MDIFERKKNLRNEVKKKASLLTSEYCAKADSLIEEKVLNLNEYENAKTCFFFVGLGAEPNTKGIIQKALDDKKVVGVPRCLSDSIMEVYEISSLEDLEEGMYGILEPKKGLRKLNPKEIDFALIPCVTADLKGNRLGHGKGYYDRFLKKTKAFTCIICRRKLISEDIPMDKNDVKIDLVITD